MKVKIFTSLAVAAAMLTIGCSKVMQEDAGIPSQGNGGVLDATNSYIMTINAGQSNSDKSTRAGIDFSDTDGTPHNVYWESTDIMASIQTTGSNFITSDFSITEDGFNATNAIFSGNVSNDASKIYFVYPSNIVDATSNEITIPIGMQNYDFTKKSHMMVTISDNYDISAGNSPSSIEMRHLLSYPRLRITAKSGIEVGEEFKVKSIAITSTNGISFQKVYNFSGNSGSGIDISASGTENGRIYIDCLNSESFTRDGAADVAFSMLPPSNTTSEEYNIFVEIERVHDGRILYGEITKVIANPAETFARGNAAGLLCDIDFNKVTDTEGFLHISTIDELKQIRSHFKPINYKLIKDIILDANEEWTPIGSKMYPYMGTIEGNGYTVKNITSRSTAIYSNGLFGYIKSSTVRDLVIENPLITSGSRVGALAGYGDDITIENCSVIGDSNSWIGPGGVIDNSIGGILGCANGDSYIIGCTNTVTIKRIAGNAGGILGKCTDPGASITIIGCYNSGNIDCELLLMRHGLVGLISTDVAVINMNNSYYHSDCALKAEELRQDANFINVGKVPSVIDAATAISNMNNAIYDYSIANSKGWYNTTTQELLFGYSTLNNLPQLSTDVNFVK